MTTEQILNILKDNRELVISFYKENCNTSHKFYTLKWFMTKVLDYANLSWGRRVNISEKDIICQMKQILKHYPQMTNGYKSNWQKAVEYHGYDKACLIANAK